MEEALNRLNDEEVILEVAIVERNRVNMVAEVTGLKNSETTYRIRMKQLQ